MITVEISDFDLGWLAGFLEGEGSFFLKETNPGRGYYSPIIQAVSTDLDTIERAHKLLGTVRISLDQRNIKSNGLRKDSFQITLSGEKAATWMKILHPLMSSRRRAAISDALANQVYTKPRTRLTYQMVKELREIYESSNVTQAELGKRFGISASNVSNIIQKRVWKSENYE